MSAAMKIATAKQIRELDRITIEAGRPSTELMERAAAAALARAAGEATGKDRPAGRLLRRDGNNGGDGVAAARLLLEAGWEVRPFWWGGATA